MMLSFNNAFCVAIVTFVYIIKLIDLILKSKLKKVVNFKIPMGNVMMCLLSGL